MDTEELRRTPRPKAAPTEGQIRPWTSIAVEGAGAGLGWAAGALDYA